MVNVFVIAGLSKDAAVPREYLLSTLIALVPLAPVGPVAPVAPSDPDPDPEPDPDIVKYKMYDSYYTIYKNFVYFKFFGTL